VQESELLREIVSLCHDHDVLCFHVYDSRKTTSPGFPDLVLAGRNGNVLFAELKSEYGTLSSSQLEWKYRISASDNHHVVWRPSDLDHAEHIISNL
jgi:VRR-NUC domain